MEEPRTEGTGPLGGWGRVLQGVDSGPPWAVGGQWGAECSRNLPPSLGPHPDPPLCGMWRPRRLTFACPPPPCRRSVSSAATRVEDHGEPSSTAECLGLKRDPALLPESEGPHPSAGWEMPGQLPARERARPQILPEPRPLACPSGGGEGCVLHGPLLESSKAGARLLQRVWGSLPPPPLSLSVPLSTPQSRSCSGDSVLQRPPGRTGWAHGRHLS